MPAICAETIPVELWWEILLRSPTKSVALLCCVSTQWRSIITDPNFRKLHHDRHATPSKDDIPDALLVVTDDVDGESVSTVSPVAASTRQAPMCRVNNPHSYSLASVCNGFLCFASFSTAKVIVCNPVTGEKLALPKAPPLGPDQPRRRSSFKFALGFSPITGVYKLFRFAERMMDVYTLALGAGGETSGWRRHPLPYPFRLIEETPPVLVGGKICVVTAGPSPHRHPADVVTPGPVLVADVTSEEHCTYSPPDYGHPWACPTVSAFELHGQLCLAIRTETVIQFWVMPVEEDDDDLPWQLLYKLKVDKDDIQLGMSAWLDGKTHTLCYKVGNKLYHRYVGMTTMITTLSSPAARRHSLSEVMSWDHKISLPATPPSSPACKWEIYAGYRPSLLSPLTLASRQHDDEDKSGLFIRSILNALQYQKSPKRRLSPTLTGCTNAKRICSRNPCRC